MKYRTLGRTELSVSEIGFGAWAIGGVDYGSTIDQDSLDALETAWDHGVNFFDTADVYGAGHSEELIGKFLKGKRDRAVVATKVGFDFYHGGIKKNFDPDYIRFACDESLKQLQTDWIDLYQLHNPPLKVIESEEVFHVLDELKEAGKVHFYGVSVSTSAEALAVIRSGKADTIQLVLNLIDQRPITEVFPLAAAKKIGIIAREPLARGLLTGKYTVESTFPENDHRSRWDRERMIWNLEQVEKLKSPISTGPLSLVRASLEFVLSYGVVSVVIPGAKTKDQVLENVSASQMPGLLKGYDHE
jgi:aryl-alcohol dehydrogenase-like predicted oxidoreductase